MVRRELLGKVAKSYSRDHASSQAKQGSESCQ